MQEIEHYHEGGMTIERLPDEGKFLLFGYDMDTTDWMIEGAIGDLWDYIILEWHYLRCCGGVGLTNSRGEYIEFW